jgi:Reverse transcriptase (RNA-dependent DNA polymerase)
LIGSRLQAVEERREHQKFDPIEFRENTVAVARWNRKQFEVPDLIGFADYEASSAAVADDLQTRPVAAEEPGLLLPFPFPKSSNSLRWLSVASPEELIVLRTAAGHVVRSTDPLLSPQVYSNRLDRRYRCWQFRPQKKAWLEFIKCGASLLDGRRHSAMYRTDVESYYSSVNLERLQSLLEEWGCLVPAAFLILKILREWQLRDGLQGLPIGPEVSAVIGNFLLHPVDSSLQTNGYAYLRWSDDILTFGPTIESCQGSMVLVDEVLSNLRLTRSVKKTRGFDNVYDTRNNLRDHWLTSLTDLLRFGDDVGSEAVQRAYDSEIRGHPEVERYRFRWVLRVLKNKHDSYGCPSLARDPSLMNIDPQLSGQYLAEAGLNDTRVTDAIMDRLSKPAENLFDGLDLHLLDAMRRRRFGDAEAKKFKSIATDSSRRWPIRVYGWAAYVRSTQDYPELMDAARAETIPQLRRGMIANLRGRSRQSFLNHARANFPESRYMVQWVQAA